MTITKTQKMNVKWARISTSLNLACWPVSAFLLLKGYELAGLLMLGLVVVTLCILFGTGVYRIVGGKPADDFEKEMQRKANHFAYIILSVVVMLGLLFARVGQDNAVGNNAEIFEFTLWAGLNFIMVVPAAVLAWLLPAEEIEEN